MTESLATKHDLRELLAHVDTRFARIDTRFAEVRGRIDQLEARFDGKLAALEHRMTLRFGGIVVTAFGAFATLVKLF